MPRCSATSFFPRIGRPSIDDCSLAWTALCSSASSTSCTMVLKRSRSMVVNGRQWSSMANPERDLGAVFQVSDRGACFESSAYSAPLATAGRPQQTGVFKLIKPR